MLSTETDSTWTKLPLIIEHARREPKVRFTSLAHLLNEWFLWDCHNSLNRNKAVGVDHVSWQEYNENLQENIDNLVDRMKRKAYKPIPARRVYIPKGARETRPLGISAHENKIVERGMKVILECIYEQDFLDVSYGFRPERSCHQALAKLGDLITNKPVNHVVEADIKGFFDNVDHDMMLEFLKKRIADTSLLTLIEKFLKAGYIDDGLLARSEEGTPQGSIISPLLANIFLHYVLDEWFETTVKNHTRGFCELVRYADDFVCVAQYAEDAARIFKALKQRFRKYGLEIHPEKSRNISFGKFERENAARDGRKPNTFDFLGITHYCTVSRKGRFKVGRKTSRKKFAAKNRAMNEWLKTVRSMVDIREWWKTLRAKLRGHYQYYGISENYRSIYKYYMNTLKLVYKWMNRRSQKRKMNWQGFRQYLEKYPLPKPRIVHNLYDVQV